MSQSVIKIELVRRAVQEVYQSPLARQSYSDLSEAIRCWGEDSSEIDEDEEKRIYDGLQSLTGFLQNKGYSSEADEIVSFTLKFFPERYFPQLPRVGAYKELDLSLFESAKQALASKPNSDKIHEALDQFEEHYRRAILNLPLLASEIAEGLFKQKGAGRAGELFRRFADAAIMLQDSAAKDNIWALMNQLAMKINITISGFNQAYLLLKALDTVKAVKPSGWLRDEMIRNENFFWRNYCWKNIDDAVVAKDKSQIIYWIDHSLPFVKTGYERTNLLLLRDSTAADSIKPFPKGILTAGIIVVAFAVITYAIWLEPRVKKSLNLEQSRKELIQSIRTGFRQEYLQPKPGQPAGTLVVEVYSRTGLREIKPPLKPHGRPLNLLEIRHAVFQKHRIDYLKEQNLANEELSKLAALEEDWLARCDFYEYNNEDREKVYWDLKIHGPNLTQDALDILNSWRDEGEVDKNALASKELLSLNNPLHVKLIIQRLRQLGCFKASDTPLVWNEACKRALKEFKATNLSIVDSVWDRNTQSTLLGQ